MITKISHGETSYKLKEGMKERVIKRSHAHANINRLDKVSHTSGLT